MRSAYTSLSRKTNLAPEPERPIFRNAADKTAFVSFAVLNLSDNRIFGVTTKAPCSLSIGAFKRACVVLSIMMVKRKTVGTVEPRNGDMRLLL